MVEAEKPHDADIHRLDGWQWSFSAEAQTEVGVLLKGRRLIWYEAPLFNPHAGGGASEQSFEDFLTLGPLGDWLSPEALTELTAAVRDRL